MLKLRNQYGDSIVEVILAIAALTMVIFLAWSVTNRASQISLAARQRTVMVDELRQQAEIIKSKYAAAAKSNTLNEWFEKPDNVPAAINEYPNSDPCINKEEANPSKPNPGASAFYFDDSVSLANGVKQVNNYDDAFVWVQRIEPAGATYADFLVRGCWQSLGGNQHDENSQFIVRLNKP